MSTNDILQRESLESDSKKKIHMFWQAYINFKIFYLIEYILPPITQFLKKNLVKFGPNLPFFKSDLSHQVLEFQNSIKYMLGIYTLLLLFRNSIR